MCTQTFDFLHKNHLPKNRTKSRLIFFHFFVARNEKCTTFAPRKMAG